MVGSLHSLKYRKGKLMKKISLMLLLISLAPYNAVAQTCATPPSCASMGYTLSAPKHGRGWLCSACPFDTTKFSCTALPCPPNTKKQPAGAAADPYTQPTVSKDGTYECYKARAYSGDDLCRDTVKTTVFTSNPNVIEAQGRCNNVVY